ncbi:hypothetical protein [Nostoc sp.]|uniref:hypothetical protein n=1 Tax=Nostoc sp. TaxID=1180 RepID=UPI002FFCE65F
MSDNKAPAYGMAFLAFLISGSLKSCQRQNYNPNAYQSVPSVSQQWGNNTYPPPPSYQSQPNPQEENESDSYAVQFP